MQIETNSLHQKPNTSKIGKQTMKNFLINTIFKKRMKENYYRGEIVKKCEIIHAEAKSSMHDACRWGDVGGAWSNILPGYWLENAAQIP